MRTKPGYNKPLIRLIAGKKYALQASGEYQKVGGGRDTTGGMGAVAGRGKVYDPFSKATKEAIGKAGWNLNLKAQPAAVQQEERPKFNVSEQFGVDAPDSEYNPIFLIHLSSKQYPINVITSADMLVT